MRHFIALILVSVFAAGCGTSSSSDSRRSTDQVNVASTGPAKTSESAANVTDSDQIPVPQPAKGGDQSAPSVGSGGAQPSAGRKSPVVDGDIQTVFAEGAGTTREEAIKDAFRAAVRQVVGEVVDGETIVKNEELVKDQVLTYSDGFIPEHKITSEKHENGLFRIGIQAKVQRRSVIMKLKGANITLKALDGQSLYGSIVTQLGAEKDAAALVAKALEGFPDNYLEARVVGEPRTTATTDSEATLVVNVEFAPSTAAYNKFASKLCKTLEGVCKMKGEFTSVIPKVSDKRGRGGGTGASNGQYFYVDGGNFQGTAAKWMPELWKAESGHWRWQSKGFAIAIATLVSADSSRIRWNYYVLDEAISHGLLLRHIAPSGL